jgi:hypothetical protein
MQNIQQTSIATPISSDTEFRGAPSKRRVQKMPLSGPAAQNYDQAGATINEFGLWAILAALVIGVAAGAFYVQQMQQRPKNEAQNMLTIYAAAKGSRDSSGYANVNTASLQRDGGIPTNMAGSSTGTVFNVWGGAVTITGTSDTITFVTSAVPANQCNTFRSQIDVTGNFTSISPCNSGGTTDVTLTAH